MKNFISFGDMETLLSEIGSKLRSLKGAVQNLGGYEAGELEERVTALEERTVEYDDTELRGLVSSEQSAREAADSALSSTVSGHTTTLGTHTTQIAALQSGRVKASVSGSTLYLTW